MVARRRDFIGGIIAAGSAPFLFGGCAGLFKANSRVNVAVIGCGRISSEFEIPCVLKRRDMARIVAVCDLDSRRVQFARSYLFPGLIILGTFVIVFLVVAFAWSGGSIVDVWEDIVRAIKRALR